METNLQTGKCSIKNLPKMLVDKNANPIVELRTDATTGKFCGESSKWRRHFTAVHSTHGRIRGAAGGGGSSASEMDWDYLAGFVLFCLFLASAVFQMQHAPNEPFVMGSNFGRKCRKCY